MKYVGNPLRIVVVFTLILLFLGTAYAKTIYVPDDYPSIQKAVDAAKEGDTIVIRKGTYNEREIRIWKNYITLTSETGNPEDVVIKVKTDIDVVGKGIVIRGLTIQSNRIGILLRGSDTKNCIIENNIIEQCDKGIFLGEWGSHSSYNIIRYNKICNNNYGIYVAGGDNNYIYLNNFENNKVKNAFSKDSDNRWYSPHPIKYYYKGKFHVNYLGNYWSDEYNGQDENGDGIGDSWYYVKEDSSSTSQYADYDAYPLMEPFERYIPTQTLKFTPDVVTVPINKEVAVNLTLDKVLNGLSGYNITVSINDSSIAEISSVEFPQWATIHSNTALPSDTVQIKAVDTNEKVQGKAENVILATLKIKGKAVGNTTLKITAYRIDDDSGEQYVVKVVNCSIRVIPLQPLPCCNKPPTDPDKDGLYEDLNGNGKIDFDDVVKFFKYFEWIEQNYPVNSVDFNGNNRIDFADIVKLFKEV